MTTPERTAPAILIDTSPRRLMGVAWPLVLHGLVTVVVAVNDVVLLGGEGARVIASAVVASSVLTVLVVALSALAIGAQIEGSRARGADDLTTLRAVVPATYRLVAAVAVPVVVGGWVVAPLLTRALSGQAADAGLAADYLRLTLLGVPFALFAAVLRSYATAQGRTRVVLVAGLVTAGSDTGLSILLVQPLGWRGVAIGTVAAYVVSATAFLVWRGRDDKEARPRWWSLAESPPGLKRRLFDLGWPEALLALFSTASGVVVVLVLADSTPEVLAAARTLDVQLMLTFMVLMSIGQAQLTILGEAVGAERWDAFDAARRHAAPVFAGAALLMFLLVAPWSGQLAGAVAGDEVAATIGSLGWLALAQVGWQAACAFCVSTCRSLRDTRASLVASLAGEYAVFLPLGLVLCRWHDMEVGGILICHHAFWLTFVGVVAWRARSALRRERP